MAIKTINWLAVASVKTFNWLAKASVKTVDGEIVNPGWPIITDSRPGWTFSTFATTVSQGETITTAVALNLISVEKDASCTATTCYIRTWTDYTGGTLLATATFVGNTATFNLLITAGNYCVYQNSGWASYNSRYFNTSYPQNRTNLNYIYAGGGNTSQRLNIENIKTQTP